MSTFHVQCGYRVHGTIRPYWAERDDTDDSKAATITDIATGQLENVLRVIEVNVDEGTARDVTEDIALEVIEWLEGLPRSEGLRNFLDTNATEAYREFEFQFVDSASIAADRADHAFRLAREAAE